MAEGGESVERTSTGAADRAAMKEVLMEVLGSLPAFRTVLAPDGRSGEDGATTSGSADGDGAMAARLAGSTRGELLTVSVGYINWSGRRSD